MPLKKRDIIKELPRKGFSKKSGSHIYFYHRVHGKFTGPMTKVSHSPKVKEISDNLITQMRKQLKLDNNQQVRDLVNCPMSGDDYTEFLKSKGIF